MASNYENEGSSLEASEDMATSSEMEVESPDVIDRQTREMDTKSPDVLDRDVNFDRHEVQVQTVESKLEEIRIAIIGRTGSGKSSLGNQILMENIFQSDLSPVSVTEETEVQSRKRSGMQIDVADTPGLFHTTVSENNVKKQIFKCIQMTHPGPHAFLYTIKIGRYSEEEIISFSMFLEIFGDDVLNHTILVFTGKDYLMEENIKKYVEKLPEDLKKITEKCRDRTVAINNMATHEENQKNLVELLDLINNMKKKNKFFSEDMVKYKPYTYSLKDSKPFKISQRAFAGVMKAFSK